MVSGISWVCINVIGLFLLKVRLTDYNTMKAKNSPHLNPIVYEYYDSLCMYNHLSLYDNLTSISDQEIRDKEWLQESMHKDKDDRSGSGGFEEDKKLHIVSLQQIRSDERVSPYVMCI